MNPWPDRPLRARLSVGLACGVVAVFSLTFLMGSTPDEEEFRFAVLSAWLHVDALRHGRIEFWTDTLGLGMPQPFTPNFLLHPLLPLLGILSPVTWVRILLLAHTLLGAAGIWQLTRRVGAGAFTSAVCVLTYLLGTPSQNYILTDFWPSHYIVWTSAPWLLLLAWRVLDADGRALRVWSVACGLCASLVIANSNLGHLIVYATVAAAVVAAHWRQVVRRLPWIAVSVLIAAAIAAPTVAQLAHERPLFAPDLGLANAREPLPLSAAWNALVSPLGPADEHLPFSRTLFFGGPFVVLCAIGCVRYARRHADLVMAVAACTILVFTPLAPMWFVSARFQFRDPLILAAVPLAALALERLLAARQYWPAALLLVAAQAAALGISAWPALEGTWISDARRAEWFRGGTGRGESVEILMDLATPPGRMVLSPAVEYEIFEKTRLAEGFGVNGLAYRGLPVLNGLFKGVSTGTVWPDERLFYGRIRTPQQMLESAASLDVLGVRYVLANADETVAGDLRRRGVIPKRNGTHFVLYENSNPWPDAVILDRGTEQIRATRLPGCDNDRLLCADLAPLAKHRSTDDPVIRHHNGRLDIRLFPADEPRLLVVNRMFRLDWHASAGDDRLTTVPVVGGLLGVQIPPGISSVQLRYLPVMVVLATAIAWCALIASVSALIILNLNRRPVAPTADYRSVES